MREFNTGKYLAACNAAYSMVRSRNGYSANIDTLEEPIEGYMVAIETLKIYPNISSVNTHELSRLLREYCQNMQSNNLFIGVWKYPETKEIYFEVALNIKNKAKAVNIGNIHNQKYIFDIENNTDIKL